MDKRKPEAGPSGGREKDAEKAEAETEENALQDPDHFSITITGITGQEYQQASRLHNRRSYAILLVLMVIICGLIILTSGSITLAGILVPAIIYFLFVIVMEVLTRSTGKGLVEEIDPVIYSFTPVGWSVSSNGDTAEFEWRGTIKLKKTRDCVFLYNDDNSSNLLPRRLLTGDQISRIEGWYQDSRSLSKEYQKQQMHKEREAMRASREKRRKAHSGPSWGPWKRDENGNTYASYRKQQKSGGSTGKSKKKKKKKKKKK